MTKHIRKEQTADYKEVKFQSLNIGDYFFHRTFERLCLKIADKKYIMFNNGDVSIVSKDDIWNVENLDFTVGEVDATVEWRRIYDN